MGRRQARLGAVVVVVTAGCLAVGGSRNHAAAETPAQDPDKHYVEIPLGPPPPASAPATEPAGAEKPASTPEIDTAIRELGDADFSKR